MTKAPTTIIYASVVLRETVRIALTIATLNDVEVELGDILYACVQAPAREKVWTTLGPEFGKDARSSAVIAQDEYGLELAGATF